MLRIYEGFFLGIGHCLRNLVFWQKHYLLGKVWKISPQVSLFSILRQKSRVIQGHMVLLMEFVYGPNIFLFPKIRPYSNTRGGKFPITFMDAFGNLCIWLERTCTHLKWTRFISNRILRHSQFITIDLVWGPTMDLFS